MARAPTTSLLALLAALAGGCAFEVAPVILAVGDEDAGDVVDDGGEEEDLARRDLRRAVDQARPRDLRKPGDLRRPVDRPPSPDADLAVPDDLAVPVDLAVPADLGRPADLALPADLAPPPACDDGVQNGGESDIDCGGVCAACAVGRRCVAADDCVEICDGGRCRAAYSCREILADRPGVQSGRYEIDQDGPSPVYGGRVTYCDMDTDGGGWTLIGKVDGDFDMYDTWLVRDRNVGELQDPAIAKGRYACMAAVHLAVDGAVEVLLSNSDRSRWVKWALPQGRNANSFWRHSSGRYDISHAAQEWVTATAWDGTTSACVQNRYGILPYYAHGGSYPATGRDSAGRTSAGDRCLAVQTMYRWGDHGFYQNGGGADAPASEADWPNADLDRPPHVAVWLR